VTGVADAERLAAWFGTSFGSGPDGVWRAPGRANLIGEHTDYNGGWVLPFALNAGVVAAAARRDDGILDVRSLQAPGLAAEGGRPSGAGAGSTAAGGSAAGKARAERGNAEGGFAAPVPELSPGSVKGWAAYPAGVVWALREAGHHIGGASIAIGSDLPQGAGLSSSAALECAVALALVDLYELSVPRQELAAITRRAENDFVGVPCGIMDQSASLLCEPGRALLLDCRNGHAESVPLDPAAHGLALMVVDTGVRHTHANGSYSLRREQCERAARLLGVCSLREAGDVSALSRLADPVLRRRAGHVVTENSRVLDTVRMLRARNLAATGALLTRSHCSLRDDFEVSWPEADVAVAVAERAGALGARMMGGGFGGSVIALVPGDGAAVRSAIAQEYSHRGWPAPRFLPAPPSPSAHRVR
jgi:galactokinase